MWRRGWRWLKRLLGRRAAQWPGRPPLAGDRDERRMEHARFQAETLHVGSHADETPPSAGSHESDPRETRPGVQP
jgi:hypothetical protein